MWMGFHVQSRCLKKDPNAPRHSEEIPATRSDKFAWAVVDSWPFTIIVLSRHKPSMFGYHMG